ncbi:MAG: hypothetical protein GY704_11070, partial [Phycisphaeraceae bacterium]|nr:hypothetical protein [Phycisphaeraceae bacterium]
AEFDRANERTKEDCLAEKLLNHRGMGQTSPGGAVAVFASSGYEFLIPNVDFNELMLEAFFYPSRATDPANLPPGSALPPTGGGGVYSWTIGEVTTRARLMYQLMYSAPGNNRQAARRYILLGDPATESDAAPPVFTATVNGVPVQDTTDPFFVNGNETDAVHVVAATVSDFRGIQSWRVVDTGRGIVPAT